MNEMDGRSTFALTPWVRRVIAANAVVYLLTITVFTGSWFFRTFAFAPSTALAQPWTFVTYTLVHAGFLHLAFNMLMLFFFGPAVEERMGGRAFLPYYLVCGRRGVVVGDRAGRAGGAVCGRLGGRVRRRPRVRAQLAGRAHPGVPAPRAAQGPVAGR